MLVEVVALVVQSKRRRSNSSLIFKNMATFKQKCMKCKKKYVIVSRGNRYPICFDCQKPDMIGEITDPVFKKMFKIPDSYYENNSFLRSIKINYLKFGKLSERQIEVFKKVVNDIKVKESEEKKEEA